MSELLAELLVPFSYNYMLKAMWVSALVGGTCAFLSAYLMLKGWSLMGDALAHSIVPGVAGAYILGAPFALGAFFAGIFGRAWHAIRQAQVATARGRRDRARLHRSVRARPADGIDLADLGLDPDHRARQHPCDLRRGRGAGRGHRRGLARHPDC